MIAGYRRAAEFSFSAVFDGVELLAATGCLPSPFQVTGSNRRTDDCGGSFEKRTRFTLEVLKSPCEVTVASGTDVRRWREIEEIEKTREARVAAEHALNKGFH